MHANGPLVIGSEIWCIHPRLRDSRAWWIAWTLRHLLMREACRFVNWWCSAGLSLFGLKVVSNINTQQDMLQGLLCHIIAVNSFAQNVCKTKSSIHIQASSNIQQQRCCLHCSTSRT